MWMMTVKQYSLSSSVFVPQKSLLFEHGIRRLTFLVAQKVRTKIPTLPYSTLGFLSNSLPVTINYLILISVILVESPDIQTP